MTIAAPVVAGYPAPASAKRAMAVDPGLGLALSVDSPRRPDPLVPAPAGRLALLPSPPAPPPRPEMPAPNSGALAPEAPPEPPLPDASPRAWASGSAYSFPAGLPGSKVTPFAAAARQ